MTTKHTPGPWAYDEKTEELRAESGVIGHVEPVSGPLCAAAPELLAHARRLLLCDHSVACDHHVDIDKPCDCGFDGFAALVAQIDGAP